MRLYPKRLIWYTVCIVLTLAICQFSLHFFVTETSLLHSVSNKLCTIANSEARKALSRTKTAECRSQIENGACNIKEYLLNEFPESMYSSLMNEFSGCYAYSTSKKVLTGANFKYNDPVRCQAECYRPGFLYYAITNNECLCGNKLETMELPESVETCLSEGVSVYRTGHTSNLKHLSTSYIGIHNSSSAQSPIKILFLFQFNGRNERQVKRLLKAIYSPEHLYFIHVDQRQKYMKREMERVGTLLSNVYVIPDGFSTIWGGASLLTMYQEVIRLSLTMHEFATWDYMINLSESDFPVLSMQELETQLQQNRGKTFLASHGYNTAQFISKQGFDHYFVECENHMWRVGRRGQFPKNVRIDGGSDWLILHRKFAEYSISNETYPARLRDLFTTILLPLESFYHTLAANSQFCDSIVGSNLKMTNWNRKQGCRCDALKNIVDWCGCSPLVIKKHDLHKISLAETKKKSYYFSRKFESLIDIDAIHFAEAQVYRSRPEDIAKDHPSFNSTFVNFYDAEIDGEDQSLSLVAKSLLQQLDIPQKMEYIDRVDIFRANSTDSQYLVYSIKTDSGRIELLTSIVYRASIFPTPTVDGFELYEPRFGSKIDHKEEVFRNPSGFVDVEDTATVIVRWRRLPGQNTTVPAGKTSPKVSFSWYNGAGSLVATQEVGHYDSIYGSQFSSLNLSTVSSSLKIPGTWKTLIHDGDRNLAEMYFPVLSVPEPEDFDRLIKSHYTVVDSCAENCPETIWSVSYPDPKSDIVKGYDSIFNVLS